MEAKPLTREERADAQFQCETSRRYEATVVAREVEIADLEVALAEARDLIGVLERELQSEEALPDDFKAKERRGRLRIWRAREEASMFLTKRIEIFDDLTVEMSASDFADALAQPQAVREAIRSLLLTDAP